MAGQLSNALQAMSVAAGGAGGNMSSQSATVTGSGTPVDQEKIYQWIQDLTNPEARENALLELR